MPFASVCPVCGAPFTHAARRRIYCSTACAAGARRTAVAPRTCERCGGAIRRPPTMAWPVYATKRFCSRACANATKRRRIDTACRECGCSIAVPPSKLREAGNFCSRACARRSRRIRRDQTGPIGRNS